MPQPIKPSTKQELCRLIFCNAIKQLFTKEELVRDYSAGRTESLSELYETEAINLQRYLKGVLNPANDQKRKRIISCAHRMGWKTEEGAADIKSIDAFLLSGKSPFKKRLNALTGNELSKVIPIFDRMAKEHENKVYNTLHPAR